MASEIKVDTISEKTSANGVSIDSVVHKDSAVYPSTADGGALGSASNEWSDLFLADSSVIKFGADQDTTLTHTDGTGLTLNSTNKLCFNDASQFVQGSSATVLSLGATDEIDLTATAIDINGTADVSGAFTAGSTIVATGSITGTTIEPNADTSAGDNAAIGYTSAEGLILTGQGSTDDITIKNDADTTILNVATGATDVEVSAGNILFGTANKGVYLGVTSATASNLLDDYETSQTWTATLTDNSSATMAATIGKSYTLIGNICTITAYIHSWTDEGDGYLKSMALPFSSAAAPRAAGALSVYGVPINFKGVVAEISGGSALLNFWELKDDAAANQYMEITGGEVMVSITYTVA